MAPFWCMRCILSISPHLSWREQLSPESRECMNFYTLISLSFPVFSLKSNFSMCLEYVYKAKWNPKRAVVRSETTCCNVSLVSSVLPRLHGDRAGIDWCGIRIKIKEWIFILQHGPSGNIQRGTEVFVQVERSVQCPPVIEGYSLLTLITTWEPCCIVLHLAPQNAAAFWKIIHKISLHVLHFQSPASFYYVFEVKTFNSKYFWRSSDDWWLVQTCISKAFFSMSMHLFEGIVFTE